ncbi:MAG: hypothetical protein ACE5HO_13760 [bacterium]
MGSKINTKTKNSVSDKLDKLKITQEEKNLIVENGLRYRILELENELRKIDFQITEIEKLFKQKFEVIEKIGLPDDADIRTHENYMDLKALVYDRFELLQKLETLKRAFELD